ncbi:MAG: hypothetical protein KatS3mg102_2712 [Planctomycetota bacterium]|nr:MAG: hypothetical protein KatS3mg102_2712 [Planctomycetota bacterium]
MRARLRAPGRWAGAVLGALLVASAPAPASEEVPSPERACREAARALAAQQSFALAVQAEGGLADRPDKIRCEQALVRRSYAFELVRPVLKVSEPEAFVLYGTYKGALKKGERWIQLLADSRGKEIPHLVRPPEKVLSEAARHARTSGQWLERAADAERWSEQPRGGDDGDSRTTSREDAAGGGPPALPSALRVIGPWQVAEQLIVEVQNSGCLSGG